MIVVLTHPAQKGEMAVWVPNLAILQCVSKASNQVPHSIHHEQLESIFIYKNKA
jgi:hypothetical protein